MVREKMYNSGRNGSTVVFSTGNNQAYKLWAIPSDISIIPGCKKQNKNNNQIRE